jgi:hypothetical protein
MKEAEGLSVEQLIKIDPTTGLKVLPHWLAQPYFRPLPEPQRQSQPSSNIDLTRSAFASRVSCLPLFTFTISRP